MSQPTGIGVLDGILWGGWQWINPFGDNVSLTYYFDDSYSSWLPEEEQAFRAALSEFAKVSNISFNETSFRQNANLIEYTASDAEMGGALGLHEPPEYATINWWNTWQEEGWYNWEGWSLPSSGLQYDPTGLVRGGYGFTVMLHEIGHALGLGHPHDTSGGAGDLMPGVSFGEPSDYGRHDLNQGVYTVMSYNDGWDAVQDPFSWGHSEYGYSKGLGALDIAAIQYLYGADRNHKDGDSVYKIADRGSWQSIWDAGGEDTIEYSGSGNLVIDLRSATLDNSSSAGGYLSYVKNTGGTQYFGGYTIAGDYTRALRNKEGERGVIIENAVGGSGDDRLQGNLVSNRLYGNAGADKLLGSDGDDRLSGGGGRDKLLGEDGDDRLIGGGGADTLVFRKGNDNDVVLDFRNNVDTIVLNDNLWKGSLTISKVIRKFADVENGDIVFDFGRDELVIADFKSLTALQNDLEIA